MERNNVIKGLQCCKNMNKMNCDKCPYDYNGRGTGKSECTAELAEDALALIIQLERYNVNLLKQYADDMESIRKILEEAGL